MPIKLGPDTVTIKVGNQQVDNIYLGNQLVYSSVVSEPWQQILNAVAAIDPNASVYDADNETTWTLREDAGIQYYSAIADGMGNREVLVQATSIYQPDQKILSTGRRVMNATEGGRYMSADFSVTIAQPNTLLMVCRSRDVSGLRVVVDSYLVSPRQQFSMGGSSYRQFAGAILDRSAPANNDTWLIPQANFDSANSTLFVNGLQIGTIGNAGVASLGGVGILDYQSGSGSAFQGSIGLVVVFSGLKTNEETANLRSVINNLYPIGISE